MLKRLSRIWKDEEGLATVEYALLMVVLAVAALTTWTTLDNVAQAKPTGVRAR